MEDQAAKQWEASQALIKEQLLLQTQQGQEAEALLSNPTLAAWWEDYQRSALELLDITPLNDEEAAKKLILSIRIVRKMKKSFEQFVENGEVAKQELKQLLELKDKGLLGRLFNV